MAIRDKIRVAFISFLDCSDCTLACLVLRLAIFYNILGQHLYKTQTCTRKDQTREAKLTPANWHRNVLLRLMDLRTSVSFVSVETDEHKVIKPGCDIAYTEPVSTFRQL